MFKFLDNFSIKNKLIVLVFMPVFLIFLLFISINLIQNLDTAKENSIKETQLLMDQYSESISNYFDIKIQILNTLAQDETLLYMLQNIEGKGQYRVETPDYLHVKKTFKNIADNDEDIKAVFTMIEKTRDYFDSGDYVTADDYDITTRYWYKALTSAKGAYLQDINFDDLDYKAYLLSIRYPMSLNGAFLGGIGIDFEIQALYDRFEEIKLNQNQQLLVFTKGGQIVRHPRLDDVTNEGIDITNATRDNMNNRIKNIDDINSVDSVNVTIKGKNVKRAPFHLTSDLIKQIRDNNFDYENILEKEVEIDGISYYVFLKKIPGIDWVVSICVDTDALFAAAYDQAMQEFIYLIILLIIGAIVLYVVNSTITKPLDEMLIALKSFISGKADLTQRLDYNRTDEVGQFAEYFDQFVNKQQKLLSLIHDNSKLVVEDAASIGDTATSTSTSFNDLLEKANNTVSATSELSVSIKQVVSNAENSVVNIGKSNEVVLKSVKDINNVLLKVNDMTAELSKIFEDVNNLKSDYREVSKISFEIADIADRISILSLNAQIEAIRAGDSGSGFNVVADEMAQLSESTKSSINFVNQITDRLEDQIAKIVEQMTDVSEMITTFQNNVNESLEKLNTIQVNSESTTNLIEQIAMTAKEQSTVSSEINTYIAELMDTMTSIGDEIRNSKDKTDAMKSSSDILLDNVSNFKL